ncbi:MAG: glycosyltransferase [Pyrinomonadaceae bacterium]|nr:glycosyltransferase [Pyrinomonadaceae bacterium]
MMQDVLRPPVPPNVESATDAEAAGPKNSEPKLKILWLASLDYQSGNAHGGNLRLINYAKQLVSSGHEVYFVVRQRATDDTAARTGCLDELRRQEVITDYFELEYHHPKLRGKLGRLLFHPALSKLLLRQQQAPAADAINEIIVSKQINLCIFTSRDLLFVLPAIKKDVTTIVDWVDSLFLYHWRGARLDLKEYRLVPALKSLRFLAEAVMQERHYGRLCGANLAVSPVDKRYLDLANGVPHKNHVLMNGVEAQEVEATAKVKNQIIFTGTMDFSPNYESAIWFIDHVFPLLRRHSDINLVIAGANPVEELLARAGDGIQITGYVENLREEIARSELYVAPLICGGGFKNKVVEAIASGTFVVGTSMAVEFLSPETRKHLLVADTAPEMAAAIVSYLQDPQKFAANLETLKRIVAEELTWEKGASQLSEIAGGLRLTGPSKRGLNHFQQEVASSVDSGKSLGDQSYVRKEPHPLEG